MIIQHNLPAMNARRNLGLNNNRAAKHLEKLASGYNINRAADDAAGLGISEKMRAMMLEHDKCLNNSERGMDAAKTADGALQEVHDMLNRARELCIQAANGTYSGEDREMIAREVDELFAEIDHITETSHYNEIPLLRWPGRNLAGSAVVGYNITGEVNPADPYDWGALDLPGVPSQFSYAADGRAKPATVTMKLDPDIDFSNWESLEGKTVTLPFASGSATYIFSQYTGTAFTERYGSPGTIIPINSSTSVTAALESLKGKSTIIPTVTVNSSNHTITFVSTTVTQNNEPLTARPEGFPMAVPGIPNPYATGTTYNGKVVSSAGKSLFALAGTYPRVNLPFTYGADATRSVAINIAGDTSSLNATQVGQLTRVNPYITSPKQNYLELNVMGTVKTVTFSTGGTPGTVTGSGNTRNIDIQAGMSGSALRTALTEAFSQLGATATWGGTNNATLSLSVSGLSSTTWGAVTLREVTVPQTGTPASSSTTITTGAKDDPEPAFTKTGQSQAASGPGITVVSISSPETGQTIYEITDWPTAQEIRDRVASNAASKAPASFGGYLFYDGTKDYGQKNVAWTAPVLTGGKTATGGSDSGTIDLNITNGININNLSDAQIMNYVYTAIGAVGPNADGKLYTNPPTKAPNNVTNNTGKLNFSGTVNTGRTIHTPGSTVTIGVDSPASSNYMPATSAQITSTGYLYFNREATVTRLPDELKLPMDGGDVDIAKLTGSGFQLQIETNANNTSSGLRRFEFSTAGTNGSYVATTGNYTINIAGCTTPDEVAARIKAAVQTATGANAAADLKVTADADGKLNISSRYLADSGFNGIFHDGYGSTGLFGAGNVTGTLAGGTKDDEPGTVVDFSSVNSSNAVDLLGKGFRIKCGTCESEYFNIMFVESLNAVSGIQDISIYTDENGLESTYYNYFVVLDANNLSGTDISGSDIVSDIISQLTPQMDHFTSVKAGDPPSTLVISDKRYNPTKSGTPAFGSVESGVYTDFTYKVVIEPIYGPAPEDIIYRDLPIYVSSVGENYINLHLPHLTLNTLKLIGPPELSFSDAENANAWLGKVDSAVLDVSEVRARFGADTNRLESAHRTLANSKLQVTASESKIRDADMAGQMAELTKSQILIQSAQAALTQGNQTSQSILSMLRTVG